MDQYMTYIMHVICEFENNVFSTVSSFDLWIIVKLAYIVEIFSVFINFVCPSFLGEL